MMKLKQICEFLDQFAPTSLAEDWDNVGLLVGDDSAEVKKVITCLTVTPASAAEAIAMNADLIVSHHPLPFRPIKKITTDKTPTRLLWQLVQNSVAIYSPHTGFDSAAGGINQSVCDLLGVQDAKPLVPLVRSVGEEQGVGAGRFGNVPETSITGFLELVKTKFGLDQVRFVGRPDAKVSKVGSACGSGGSFLQAAIDAGCDTFVTGETDFHTCLEAESRDVSLVLLGHYASERFAIEMLAERLAENFPNLQIWASKKESDPINWT